MPLQKVFKVAFEINGQISGNFAGAIKSAMSQMQALKNAASASNAAMSASARAAQQYLYQLNNIQRDAGRFLELKKALPQTQAALIAQQQKSAQISADIRRSQAAQSQFQKELEALKALREAAKASKNKAEYKGYQEEIKKTAQALKEVEKYLKQAGKEFTASNRKAKELKDTLQIQMQQLQRLRSSLGTAGFNVSSFASSEQRLRAEIEETTRAMERQAQAAQRLSAAQQRYDMAQSRYSDAQSNFQTAKSFAGTLLSPFTESTKNAIAYEYELANVKALSQIDDIRAKNFEVVNANMAELDKEFKHLGATTEYTATEIGRAAGYFAMAGWDKDKILAAMPAFMNLATTTRTANNELGRLSDVFTDDMTAAGVQAGKLYKTHSGRSVNSEEYFANTFAYAITKSNLNRESLHEGIKYYAPIAAEWGLDLAEMFGAAMTVANAGIKGSQAGTGLRAGLLRLVGPPKQAGKALEELGLTMSDAQKEYNEAQSELSQMGVKVGDFRTTLLSLSGALNQLDAGERLAKINKIFGRTAATFWTKILQPGSVEQFAQYADFMESEKIDNYVKDTAGVMRGSTHVQLELLKSSIDAVKLAVGDALLPVLQAFLQAATPLLSKLAEWINKNPALVRGIAAITAGLAAMAVSVTGAALAFAAFDLIGAQMALFGAGMAGAEVATAGFAARLGGLARAFKGLAIWSTLAPLLKFSGWAKIGGGLAGGFAGLRTLGLAGVVSMIGGKLTGAATRAASAIKSIGTAFLSITRAGLSFAFSPIGLALTALALTALLVYKNWSRIEPVISSLAQTFSDRIAPAVATAQAALSSAGDSINALFETLTGSSAADVFLESFIVAIKTVAEAIAALVQFVAHSVAAISELFGGLAKTIDLYYKGDYAGAKKAAMVMASETAYNIEAAITEPLETLSNLPTGIEQAKEFTRAQNQVQELEKQGIKAHVDRQTGEVIRDYTPAKAAAKTYASGTLNEESLKRQAAASKQLQILQEPPQEITQSLWQQSAKSQAQKDRAYRLWKVDQEFAEREKPAQSWRNENAATWQKAQWDYNLSKNYFTPQAQTLQTLKAAPPLIKVETSKTAQKQEVQITPQSWRNENAATWQKAQWDYNLSKKYFTPQAQTLQTLAAPPLIKVETSKTAQKQEVQITPQSWRNENAATWQKAQWDYNLSKKYFTPQAQTLQTLAAPPMPQTPAVIQSSPTPARQNENSVSNAASAAISSALSTTFNTAFIPFANFSNLLFGKAAAATPESVQLNTEQAQAQIDTLGAAAQVNSTALQATGAAAQANSSTLQATDAASQQLSNSLNVSNAAVTQNAAALNASNSAVTANTASVQQNSAAAQVSVSSINQMSGAAQSSTGNITSLSSASSSASGSISGLGAAAQSAISSLLAAGASAVSSIRSTASEMYASAKAYFSGDGAAKNAKGGIYNHGAFLTWFAEKSPEAAIPLDGSERAINLWQTAGQLLGVYPAENYNGGIYKNGGQSISLQKISAKNGNVDLNLNLTNKNFDDSAKTFTAAVGNFQKLKPVQERINQKTYERLKPHIDEYYKQNPQEVFSGAAKQIQKITPAQERINQKTYERLKGQKGKSPLVGKTTNALENIYTPESVKEQRRIEEELKRGRAKLPEEVRKSKSYEALNRPSGRYPQAITAPKARSPIGLIRDILSGNWKGAIEKAGEIYSRKIEIDEWNKKHPDNSKIPDVSKIPVLNAVGQKGKSPLVGKTTNALENIYTPESVKEQRRIEKILERGRAGLPEQVKRSKSYEALNRPSGRYPQAITAPKARSPVGLIRDILSGNWKGAIEKAGEIYSRKIEIDEWNKKHPDNSKIPDVSKIPVLNAVGQMANPLNAQFETLNAQNGGTFNTLESSTQNNSTAELPPINLNFTINIQGNADKQDVENGVKETIPLIQESFESQFRRFMGERSRRAFL